MKKILNLVGITDDRTVQKVSERASEMLEVVLTITRSSSATRAGASSTPFPLP